MDEPTLPYAVANSPAVPTDFFNPRALSSAMVSRFHGPTRPAKQPLRKANLGVEISLNRSPGVNERLLRVYSQLGCAGKSGRRRTDARRKARHVIPGLTRRAAASAPTPPPDTLAPPRRPGGPETRRRAGRGNSSVGQRGPSGACRPSPAAPRAASCRIRAQSRRRGRLAPSPAVDASGAIGPRGRSAMRWADPGAGEPRRDTGQPTNPGGGDRLPARIRRLRAALLPTW